MNTKNSINESLEVIRRALEDEKKDSNKHSSSNILILNQKVNSDGCLLYTSPSPRDATLSRMPSSA